MQQPKPLQLNALQQLVDDHGAPTQYFREFIAEITRYLPIIGDGPPEGVIEAQLYTPYIDRNGSAGNVEYRKMQAEIGGDRSKGWVEV